MFPAMMVLDHWDLSVPTRFSTSIRGVRGHWRMPCHSYHKGDILTARKNNATKKMTQVLNPSRGQTLIMSVKYHHTKKMMQLQGQLYKTGRVPER